MSLLVFSLTEEQQRIMTSHALIDSPVVPRVVGRYALFGAIASGGMASVHVGRLLGPAGFSRTVAIKRLHENFAKEQQFVSMFLDEARLASSISHPNVVTMLDVVTWEGELLLVMEYVSGASLSRLLGLSKRQAASLAPIPIIVDVMIGVLNGLHAAHKATSEFGEHLEIVHRDVSPQNVLVGDDGIARVLDFGIAKAVGCLHTTRPDEIKGKIRYVSPENISQQSVTRASDIYSASVVLWEALAGRRLFDGENHAQILSSILEGNIVAPSCFREGISRKLDEIAMCGLQRNPGERFRSAAAMARELEVAATPVSRSTIASWVMERAGDEIRARERYIRRVEAEYCSSSRLIIAPSASAPFEENDADCANTSLLVSLVVASKTGGGSARRSRGSRPWLLVLVPAMVLIAIVVALGVSRTHRATAPGLAVAASTASEPRVLRSAQVSTNEQLGSSPTVARNGATTAPALDDNGPVGAKNRRPPTFARRIVPSTTHSVRNGRDISDRIYRRD